jgi:hypothetical protein
MDKIIEKLGGRKVAILIAIILGAIAIFGVTIAGDGHRHDSGEHGHSHD